MTVIRNNTPVQIPIREDDTDNKCPYGVEVDPSVEEPPACPVCGDYPCTCGCLRDSNVAVVGGPTCCKCHWHIGILDGSVCCAHPVRMTGDE